jgi:hypothetical protein
MSTAVLQGKERDLPQCSHWKMPSPGRCSGFTPDQPALVKFSDMYEAMIQHFRVQCSRNPVGPHEHGNFWLPIPFLDSEEIQKFRKSSHHINTGGSWTIMRQILKNDDPGVKDDWIEQEAKNRFI